MTLDQLANLGELVGGVGVIASLLFVGFQLRQITRTLKISANDGIVEQIRDSALRIAENDGIASSMLKGFPGEELDGLEKYRFALVMQSYIFMVSNAFFQRRSGVLDPETWESIASQFKNAMNSPGASSYWRGSGTNYPEEFASFVNGDIYGSNPESDEWRPGR